jgi:iron complex outermembrane receptor protein
MIAAGELSEDYTLYGYYRWTNIGTRDDNTTDTQWDVMAGFKGDITDNISYETYFQSGRYDSISVGTYYLSYTGLDYVLANGLDPFSAEGAAAMRASPLQINTTQQHKAYGHMQFGLGDWLGAGDTIMLVGAEYVETDFSNQYDAASEGGFIGGSAGNSSSGTRDFTALFFELSMPLTDNMGLDVAGRYDDYSDFGGAFSPSISYNWNVLDNLSLRARWGEGFKAPALSALYGPETFSAETAYDPVLGVRRQFDTYYNVNPDLEAEESESISLGLNWEYFDGHTVDLAYYVVKVDNVITQPSAQSLLYADAFGRTWDPDSTRVERSPTGNVQGIYSYAINGDKLQVSGIDFQMHSIFDTGIGLFSANLFVSHQLEYKQNAYFGGGFQDTAGFYLQPDTRAQGSLIWDLGDFGIDLIVNYIGPHSEEDNLDQETGALTTSSNELDSWTTADLAFRWNGGAWGQFKLGANNVTDEDPVLDIQGKYADGFASLYDAIGRVYYIEYTKDF